MCIIFFQRQFFTRIKTINEFHISAAPLLYIFIFLFITNKTKQNKHTKIAEKEILFTLQGITLMRIKQTKYIKHFFILK